MMHFYASKDPANKTFGCNLGDLQVHIHYMSLNQELICNNISKDEKYENRMIKRAEIEHLEIQIS